MDAKNDTARVHRAGGDRHVSADGAHSATVAAPVNEAVKTRKRLNAASGEVIGRLKASHPAFASQRPLAIGIRATLAAAHPEIDPRLLHIALSRWCGHPGYLKGLAAGGPRYGVDGTPSGEVSEEHKAAAVLRLQRPAGRPSRTSPPKVPPGRQGQAPAGQSVHSLKSRRGA